MQKCKSRGLGFTTVATSGNECVRWNRVDEYLHDLDLSFHISVENHLANLGFDKSVENHLANLGFCHKWQKTKIRMIALIPGVSQLDGKVLKWHNFFHFRLGKKFPYAL